MINRRIAALLAAAALFGCERADEPTGTQHGTLGESSLPVIFGGDEVGLIPNYDERVVLTFSNRVRVNTDNFDIRDMDGNIIPPQPPMQYNVGMAEAGKWQGQHALTYSCICPQDPMQEPAAWNSCCEVGFVNGEAQCIGPITDCAGGMEQADRWGVLNQGLGQITSEFYANTTDPEGGGFGFGLGLVLNNIGLLIGSQTKTFAPSVSSVAVPPNNCLPPEDSCGEGTCVDGTTGEPGCVEGEDPNNPDCIGLCSGGPRDGGACNIPEPLGDECDPENYPRSFYWTYGFGRTDAPTPTINDAIHITLPGANMGDPAILTMFAHYYDPVGDPRSIELVMDGQCSDLTLEFERPGNTGGDAGGADMGVDMGPVDFPSHGDTYIREWTQGDLAQGCYRYIIAATDSEGFVHTYPSLGSLGMAVTADGIATGDVEGCPIWEPTRPATTCLATANECNDGDTRLCYSGREGTQGKGECTAGTETCARGRWNGECTGEVLPVIGETCGDQIDNNCNGYADEGCPVLVMPPDMDGSEDMGNPNNDNNQNNTQADMGTDEDTGTVTPTPKDDDGDDGCCATTTDNKTSPALLLFAILVGVVGRRMRRR